MTTTTYFTKIERMNGTTIVANHATHEEMMAHINAEANETVKAYKMVNGKAFCQVKVN